MLRCLSILGLPSTYWLQVFFLVKVFATKALRVEASTLHSSLIKVCEPQHVYVMTRCLRKIWKVPPEVMKVLVLPAMDQSSREGEDVYVDIRCKAKPERTKEVVELAMKETSDLFRKHGYAVNIRVELYEPSLQRNHFSKM